MNFPSLLAAPALAALFAAALPAQQPTDPGGAVPQASPEALMSVPELEQAITELEGLLAQTRAQGLKSVRVNGVALSPQHVRREALHLVGTRQVQQRIDDCFVEEWRQEAIKTGRDPKEFELDEASLQVKLEEQVKEFRLKNPGVPFWEAVRAMTGMSREAYLYQHRQTEVFNKVFFPGPAANWPTITREAIMASAADNNGQAFWENLEKTSVDEEGKPRELPPFWMMLCRQWVSRQLKKWSDIRYPSDGLAPDVALVVNGVDWKTDDAFATVRDGLFQQDIERAMTEVVVREALRQELEKHGAYIDDEQFRADFDEYRKEFDDTPFNTEVIAVHFKGYPSLEAFRQRWRLMRSFEKLIEKDINDDNLQAHANKFSAFFGEGSVTVDGIQLYARDLKTGAWLPDGMEKAHQRADAAFAAIKDGTSFDQVHAERGEYYTNDTEKGRFAAKPLNQLRQLMRENEFSDLLNGYSVAHYCFYDAPVGKVIGPLRSTDAWWIVRVNSRTGNRGAVTISDERTRDLVKQDYIAWRFLQWANEVVGRAKVE